MNDIRGVIASQLCLWGGIAIGTTIADDSLTPGQANWILLAGVILYHCGIAVVIVADRSQSVGAKMLEGEK
jgi:hypothetical protein